MLQAPLSVIFMKNTRTYRFQASRNVHSIGVARGYSGCRSTSKGKKNVLNLGGEVRCKCTPRARVHPGDISVSGGESGV